MAKKKVKTKKKVSVGKPLKVVSKKSKKVSVKAVPPRKVSKKNVKNVSLKRVPKRKVNRQVPKTSGSIWTWFLSILFLALFGYAGYLIWYVDWEQGIYLIILLLGIILVGKLIKRVRR
jgi:membrane glycosyltransferase